MQLCSDQLEGELTRTLAISCVLGHQNPRVAIFRVSSGRPYSIQRDKGGKRTPFPEGLGQLS